MDGIADVYFGTGFCHLIIYEYTPLVAGIFGYSAALDKAGVFKKFIYTHIVLL